MIKSNTLHVKLYDIGTQVVKYLREYSSPGLRIPQ
jgi:hypothetical protein